MRKLSILTALTVCLLSASVLVAEDKPTDKKTDQKAADTKSVEKGPAINKFCAVEGGDHTVDADVYTIYKGQKIGFCCKDCVKDFESDPDTYMQKLHARKDDGGAAKKDEGKKEEKK